MLSTIPSMLLSESFLGNHLSPGFRPWDSDQPPVLFHPPIQYEEPVVFSPQPSQEPVSSNSGLDATNNSAPLTPNSGSDEPKRKNSKTLNSVLDDRKHRRMISNRESARRSRMRKLKHLENLRNQLNRLRIGNRELMNRVRLALHQNELIRRENESLRSEAVMLRQRLWDIRQVLLVRQLQQQLNPFCMAMQ